MNMRTIFTVSGSKIREIGSRDSDFINKYFVVKYQNNLEIIRFVFK